MRHVLADRPHLTPERLERTRTLMNGAVRDCLVTGYEDLIESLSLPDSNDRHVLAAAMQAGAEVIVTFNLKDFPTESLTAYGIAAVHPDEFVQTLFDTDRELVCECVRRQREGLRNPPQSVEQLLATLENQGLVQTVARLRLCTEML